MIRCMILCLLLMLATVSFADQVTPDNAAWNDPLAEQMQTLQASVQAQIDALTVQMKDLDPAQKADAEAQIVEIKRQGEVQRLTLLLESAQAAGDANRVAKIQNALNHWQNPPQTEILPQIVGEKVQTSSEPQPPLQQQPTSPNSSK